MGLFSVAQLAELAKEVGGGTPEIYPLLKVAAPGKTFLWTSKGFGSLTHGAADERILDWGGEFGPDVDLSSDSIASWEMRVTVADLGEREAERRQFAREFSKYRSSLIRSVATLYPFASPNVPMADTFSIPLLVGVPQQVASMIWEIPLSPDDRILRYGVIPKVPLAPYFPNLHANFQGQYAPIVYGKHDSNAANGKGFIPCPYVDQLGFRYLVSMGRIKTLRAVYKDGVLVSSGYSLVYETIKGTEFSLVDFTADQGVAAEITADVEGLTENGDGTGNLITNPARQWAHALANFGYNDWRQGAFFADSTASIETTALTAAADFLDGLGYEGSYYVPGAEQQKLIDFTNLFLHDHPLYAYWSPAAKIALGFVDHRPPAMIYPTGTAVIEADVDEEEQGLATEHVADTQVKEINVQYIKSDATGEYHANLKVADLSVQDEITSALQLDWAARRL